MHASRSRYLLLSLSHCPPLSLSPPPLSLTLPWLLMLKDSFDIYTGIETERRELTALKKTISVVEPVPRLLPGTSKKVYDFEMDRLLLRLLKLCPVARQQVNDTIVEWRTKTPKGPRIISDVIHGKVFMEHAILGELLRVTREEAQEMARKGAHIQWAIILWGDAFVVTARLN